MSYDLNARIAGKVWKFGDSIDSDAINPYYLFSRMEDLKAHTMEAFRPEFAKEVRSGDIIVAGRNFGCGSHRPGHVLREVGAAAIVAESVSRLFLRNNIALPLPIFIVPGITGLVEDHEVLEIDYAGGQVRNVRTGKSLPMKKYPAMIEEIYACGGLPNLARRRYLRETGAADA